MDLKDRTKEELIEELETQSWGLNKTNEAIKVLYKELEQKNRELRKLDDMKNDFINTVSHELRTPLTTVREVISQFFEGIFGPVTGEQKEFLAICLQDVDRLKRLIDDLLDVSKLEAGRFKLNKEEYDIAGLARGAAEAFNLRAKSLNLELKKELPDEKLMAYVDKDSISRVFTNLIGNALKFTAKGHIEISVADKPGHIECAVSDTGKGIAEDDLPKLFSKFQQFGRREEAREKGTGLGLSIVKHIIDLHKGRIWAESKPGTGSRFIFTLPKYSAEQIVAERAAEEAGGKR